ncbi:MAG: hypothetical protein OXB90_09920, partial [Acidimicrobiaceae bacterium]|nr:hypothetical protein [Acidimicrobiaceae bacterium]
MTQPTSSPKANHSDMELCVEVAQEAGRVTLDWFNKNYSIDLKRDGSPVTAADLAVETLIRERLTAVFPHDGMLGEEHADTSGSTKRTWVIDPIDGTKAFVQGVPLFANLLALVDEHGPAVGVINLPALGETIWAGRGLGAFFNGEKCCVNDRRDLIGAFVCTSGFGYWPKDPLLALLESGVRLRTWGDAYGYALVATGRAEAMLDPEAFAWDLASVAVVISEAGGSFTSFGGAGGVDVWRSGSAVASNAQFHED